MLLLPPLPPLHMQFIADIVMYSYLSASLVTSYRQHEPESERTKPVCRQRSYIESAMHDTYSKYRAPISGAWSDVEASSPTSRS